MSTGELFSNPPKSFKDWTGERGGGGGVGLITPSRLHFTETIRPSGFLDAFHTRVIGKYVI